MVKINKEEYELLKSSVFYWKWIVREEDGRLYKFHGKPKKVKGSRWIDRKQTWLGMSSDSFQFIQWEDEEPYSIAELIEEYERYEIRNTLEECEETEVKKLKEIRSDFENKLMQTLKVRDPMLKIEVLNIVSDLFNQLDEPEVLSPEWIDYNRWQAYDPDGRTLYWVISESDLEEVLVPKQEEVKVPKMWHDVIVQNKEDGNSLRWTLNYVDNLNVNDVDSFAKAWLDYPNIEVEEPKYYALIKGHENIQGEEKYWNYDEENETLEVGRNKVQDDVLTDYTIQATLSEWEGLGVNEDNAEFVKVNE